MSCVCHSAACHLVVDVESAQGGELLATVVMKAANHEWVIGSLLWPRATRQPVGQPQHVPMPTSWVNSTGRIKITVSIYFETVNMSAATSWNERRHPAFEGAAQPERARLDIAASAAAA